MPDLRRDITLDYSEKEEFIYLTSNSLYKNLGFLNIDLKYDDYVISEPYSSILFSPTDNAIEIHLSGLRILDLEELRKVIIIRFYQLFQVIACNKLSLIKNEYQPKETIINNWSREFEELLTTRKLPPRSALISNAIDFWYSYGNQSNNDNMILH
jgi:hypothetical protein